MGISWVVVVAGVSIVMGRMFGGIRRGGEMRWRNGRGSLIGSGWKGRIGDWERAGRFV
jgi:hypothetical protein